jgi:hypothetical protein
MACSFKRFRKFESALTEVLGTATDQEAALTFFGSGDFHHVTFALLRRLQTPFNLLILDNHPDWMRGVPILHCGTWVAHALRLPNLRRIFHVGGNVDFDNAYRLAAPWCELIRGKVVVLPAFREFSSGSWARVWHHPLRKGPGSPVVPSRIEKLIEPYREELASCPIYVSIDKDVLVQQDAVVNWDSGHLRLAEVCHILCIFLHMASGRLAGADILGDWSPVVTQGPLRRLLDWIEHPALPGARAAAMATNQHSNVALVRELAPGAASALHRTAS